MEKREWKKIYKQTMIDNGVDKKFAEECYQAAVPSKTMLDWGHDYESDPSQAALDEMCCWEE